MTPLHHRLCCMLTHRPLRVLEDSREVSLCVCVCVSVFVQVRGEISIKRLDDLIQEDVQASAPAFEATAAALSVCVYHLRGPAVQAEGWQSSWCSQA